MAGSWSALWAVRLQPEVTDGSGAELGGRAFRNNLAGIQHDDAVHTPFGLDHVVGYEHDGTAFIRESAYLVP